MNLNQDGSIPDDAKAADWLAEGLIVMQPGSDAAELGDLTIDDVMLSGCVKLTIKGRFLVDRSIMTLERRLGAAPAATRAMGPPEAKGTRGVGAGGYAGIEKNGTTSLMEPSSAICL